MDDAWSPEFPVDRDLAARLIGEQFPQLDTDTLTTLGVGWEHRVWRCEHVAFRFPQRRACLRSGLDGANALARLAPLLPLATPEPLLTGAPTGDYPGNFVGYRWIDGELPARLPLSLDDRARAALPLAAFARALHGVSAARARSWGLTLEGERGSMSERARRGRGRAEDLRRTAFTDLADRAAQAMAAPPPECTPSERRVVHGDLHAGQVLFDRDHTLVGVIDWDSLALGDPAFDLIMASSFIPPSARSEFWNAYGDRAAEARARHLALSYGLAILAQGVATGDGAIRDEAALSLENTLR